MSELNKFLRSVRADEYDKAEADEKALQENAQGYREYMRERANRVPLPIKQMRYSYEVFKTVLSECVGNLYISSLVIDEPGKYEQSLRESVNAQLSDIIKDCKNSKEVASLFENASMYVKQAVLLAEAIGQKKAATLKEDEPFKAEVVLDADDKKMIDDFEKVEGKEDYGKAIQDRVVEVFKAEEKLGEQRKERAQNLIDDMSKSDGKLNESAIQRGLNTFSEIPDTIFHAIYMNRSKMIINENASADLDQSRESILAETVCVYTLLECVHSLGLKTFSFVDKKAMRTQIHLGK